VIFSHYVSLFITVPLAAFSVYMVWRSRGPLAVETLVSLVGSTFIVLNPVYNLMEDLSVVEHNDLVFLVINILTWVGIIMSTMASIVSSRLHLQVSRWIKGAKSEPMICER
jgi:hypothetical protein